MKKLLMTAVFGATLAGFCAAARGQSLLSTLGSTYGAYWITEYKWDAAQEFTTGGQSENISSVSLDLIYTTDSTLQVGFYTDNSGMPGSLVANGLLTDPARPTASNSGTINTFTASGLTLAANTSYLLVFSDPGDTYVMCTGSIKTNLVVYSGVGYALGDTIQYYNSSILDTLSDEYVPLFSIDGTEATPEPSTLALGGMGALAGLRLIRRRK